MAERTLIYIDLAYTSRIVRARGHEDFWHARHSDGFFSKVIGIHPIADIADNEVRHRTRLIRFSPHQLVIEGTSQACKLPPKLLPLNFPLSQLALLNGLRRALSERPIAAVYANDPLYAGLFGWALARMLRRPLIIFVPAEFDQLYAETGKLSSPRIFRTRRMEQAALRFVLSRADMVVAVANSVRDLALRYGTKPERIAELSHGKFLARAHFSPPDERPDPGPILDQFGIQRGSPLLIYVGRHHPVKYPDDAVRAMAHALRDHPEATGVMTGDGEMRGDLGALSSELGMRDRIIFTGLVDQTVLTALVPLAVTLSPLTGMALMECALGGSPIVAYDCDWQGQFVRDGEMGFVVPFRDWRAMGDAAARLLDDPALRTLFGNAGRARALAWIDLEGNMAREQKAFADLLARWDGAIAPPAG